MIMQYGMSDVLGPIAYGESQNHQVFLGRDFATQRNYSEEVASEIDKEVHKYLEEAYEACRTIINEHRHELDLIAQALIDKETLTAAELKAIVFGEPEENKNVVKILDEMSTDFVKLAKENKTAESNFEPENSNPTPV